MKAYKTLALSLLLGCASSKASQHEQNAEHTVIEQTAHLEQSTLETVVHDKSYSLRDDPERLDALRQFYTYSLDSIDIEKDPFQHLVLIDVQNIYGRRSLDVLGHGYLLDDCGLVLTANHLIKSTNLLSLSVRDQEGHIYPAHTTNFTAPYHDYTIIVADTGKPPCSHPLKTAAQEDFSFGSPVTFATLFEFPAFIYSDYSLRVHPKGSIISLQDYLAGTFLFHFLYRGFSHDILNLTSIQKELEKCQAKDNFFFSGIIRQGYSGTLLFQENGDFLGLEILYTPFVIFSSGIESGGYGIAVKSTSFFDHLKFYLDGQDVVDLDIDAMRAEH